MIDGPQGTDTLPDFSNIFKTTSDSSAAAQDPTGTTPPTKKTTADPGGLPDFSNIFQGPPMSDRKLRVLEANKIKSDFYDSIGLKTGALKSIVDIIPSTYLKMVGTDPADIWGAVKGDVSGIKDFVGHAIDDPGDALKQVMSGAVMGIVRPFVQEPIELMVNKQFGMGELMTSMGEIGQSMDDPGYKVDPEKLTGGGAPLTPEEREQKGKSIAGNIIGWVLGSKVSGAVESGLVGQEALIGGKGLKKVQEAVVAASQRGVTDEAAAGIITDGFSAVDRQTLWKMMNAKILPKGVRSAISGTVGGAAGGFSMGYLEGQDSEESLQAGLAYATMAMPFGVVMESVGAVRELAKPTGDLAESVAQRAAQAYNLRQVQFSTDQPPGQMLFNLNNLAEGQSLAATLALKQIEYKVVGQNAAGQDMIYGRNASVIPTDNPLELMKIVAERQNPDSPAVAVSHARGDGIHDVLIAPADVPPKELDFFKKTGYLHGQQVGYAGHDGWVIEDVQQLQGKQRTSRVELRNLATDERVQDVKVTQLTRLSSDAPGDLRVHFQRPTAFSDVYVPENSVDFVPSTTPVGKQPSPEVFNMIPDELKAARELYTSEGDASAASKVATDFAKSPLKKDFIQALRDQVGETITVWRKGDVKPGQLQSYTTNPDGGWGGSTNRLRSYKVNVADVSFPGDPARGELVINSSKVKDARVLAQQAIEQPGLSFFKRDRAEPSRLTAYTQKSLETHVLEDFLDHIGATPDGRYMLSPDDVIAYAGFKEGEVGGAIGAPGEAVETLKGRLHQSRLNELSQNGKARLFTESKKPLTIQEAREQMREQMRSDAVPTTRTPEDRPIDRTNMPWNAVVQSYAIARGVKPEMLPQLALFLEKKIGNELLGENTIRSRLANKESIPILQDVLTKTETALEKFKGKEQLTESEARTFKQLTDTREVFKGRIEQIKNAEPLPFTDQERSVYSRLMTEAEKSRQQSVADLAKTATTNGYLVEQEGSNIRLRDAETNTRYPDKFASHEQAIKFINESGRSKGIDLDGGGNNMVPPSAVAGGGMSAPDPQPRFYEVPHQFAPNTAVSKIQSFLDTVAPWATPKRAFMVALDNKFGTRFYTDTYLPLQSAKMKLEALKRPFMKQVQEIEGLLQKSGLTRDAWKRVSQFRETMAPSEVISHYIKGRSLTPLEQDYARQFAENNIDLNNVYSYTRAVGEMNKEFQANLNTLQSRINETQDPVVLSGLKQELDQLHQSHKVDIAGAQSAFGMDPRHLGAAKTFEEIKSKDINEASLDAVTRLARSIMGNEKSRGEFALANKMHPAELEAARKIDALYSAVAQTLGIDERLTNYLNHFRQYTELPNAAPAKLKSDVMRGTIKDLPALASEMIRSGEMNVYETDPITALVQYVNTTFSNKHFNPVWKDAANAAVRHLNQIPKGRDAAANVINEYIGGMRGVPAASDQLAQVAFNKMLDGLGIDVHPDIRKDLVNTWLAAQSGAFLGFRPAQGVRDFAQFSKMYYSRFGALRYKNGLELAFKRDANGVKRVESLALEGKIPGLSILQFASEEELANGIAGKAGRVRDAIFSASELGLKVSAQHNAYSMAHAIAYLDTHELATNTLLELSRGKITKETAYKKLQMNSYDVPVAEGFDRLVIDGKMNEAAEYLAQSTGAETAFLFGMQNHPYGWGTNIGRIAGNFGTWSVWDRNFITRLAARGTPLERAAAMGRLASAEVATGLAGKALGFNMRSWYMIPGMLFGGGPAFAYVEQLEDMMGQRGKLRQEMATKQLTSVKNGQVPIISQVTPGASAFSDYFQAWQLSKNRYGPIPVLGKGLGFSVDQTQRSFVDELTDNHPRLKP